MSKHQKSQSIDKKRSSSKNSKQSKTSSKSKSPKKQEDDIDKLSLKPQQEKKEEIINLEQKCQEITIKDKICVIHQYPFSLFCETCEEPICQQCTIIGPHNSQLHRLNELPPAYLGRQSYLSEIITQKLLPKRESMIAQIHRIEYRIEELHYVKTLIERDARIEHSQIIQELKSSEGNKLAILQNEMAQLQKDLDQINDIQQFYWKITTKNSDTIAFLLQFQQLKASMHKVIDKPFKLSIDVDATDLPRVLTQKRLQHAETDANNSLLDFKNIVIFQLVQQMKEIQANKKNDMTEAMNQEIQHWVKLAEKFVEKLQKFQFCCYYCGKLFKVKNVNETCKSNKIRQQKEFVGYTLNEPDNSFHENQKHFWGQPKDEKIKEKFDKKLEKIMKLQEKFSKKKLDPKKKEQEDYKFKKKLFKNKFHDKKDLIFFEMQMAKIKQSLLEKKIDIRKVFEDHDKQSTKTINFIQFSYILTEILGINSDDIDKVMKLLDLEKTKVIEYEKVIPMILDVNYIEDVLKPKKKKQSDSKENISEKGSEIIEQKQ